MIEKYVFGGQFKPPNTLGFDKKIEVDGMEIAISQGTFTVEINNPTISTDEATKKVKSKMDEIAASYAFETEQFMESEIMNMVSHERRTDGGKLIKAGMGENVSVTNHVQWTYKSDALFVRSDEVAFDKSSCRVKELTDEGLSLAIHFYNKALQDRQYPLMDLNKAVEAIEKTGKKKLLNFSEKEDSRFGKLCNHEPLYQSRHAKEVESISGMRELTDEERDFCFKFVRGLIEEYERYLRTNSNPSSTLSPKTSHPA